MTSGRSGAREDAARLAAARRVIAGDAPQGEGTAVYAVYVAVLAAGAYGVPAAQQLFRYVDPAWLATHLLGARGVAVGAALLAALLVVAYRAGRLHGPVVPDLPYLDHVAVGPLDRAVVLRRWWRLGLLGCLVGGLLAGLVVGAGLAIAGVSRPVVLVPTTVGGTAVGVLTAGAWLHGQVRGWPTGDRGLAVFLRQRRSLRALHLTALRAQSARSVTVGGAVLAGDLRAVRLDVAPPTTRGRRHRLRARGPVGTIVGRDMLGLRRAPGALVTGVVLVSGAAYGLVHSATRGTPTIIALVGLLLAYLGVGQWAEGLRLHADNSGTTALLGVPPRTEAVAHLGVPGALYAGVTLAVAGATLAAGGGSLLGAGWALAMLPVLLAAQLMAAFRGLPPMGLIALGRGLGLAALWYLVPLLVPVVIGTVATAMLTVAVAPTSAVLVLALGSWAAVSYGRRRVRILTDAHRD